MDNSIVASLTTAAPLREQPPTVAHTLSETTCIDFPVVLRPAVVDGVEVPGVVAVKRVDTGRVFAFRSRDYRLIPNSEIFPVFDEAVMEGFDVTDMRVIDEVAKGGARVVRRYQLPAHQREVNVGDVVELELKVVNSYDGSMGLHVQCGATRLVCLNGMTLREDVRIYARHTKGFEAAGLADRVRVSLALFEEGTKQWLRWVGRYLGDEQATGILDAMPNTNPRRIETLTRYWHEERERQGRSSVWALYNAATRWATHEPVKRAAQSNRACIVLKRHHEVLAMTRSGPFLAAVQ